MKFEWSVACQESFDKIIHALTNPPLLIYPDFKKEFILTTDASDVGIGAILSQLDNDGNERVVAYASRSLKDHTQIIIHLYILIVTHQKECKSGV